MTDQGTYIAVSEARAVKALFGPERESLDVDVSHGFTKADAKVDGYIALIESRTFVRECMHRGMQAAFSLPVVTYSKLAELELQFSNSVALVLLSLTDAGRAECAKALKVLSELNSSIPIVVLATTNDVDLARTAINYGAKGYIPCTTSFEIAVEAVRFILAGGTYVPMDCLLASGRPDLPASQDSPLLNVLTSREVKVVQAIQQGKSNKVIAYDLGICESTVKVHLRNVMKKLKAKNRTEVAIKSQAALALDAATSEVGH